MVEERVQDNPVTSPKIPVRLHAYAASFGGDFARECISENMERGGTLLDPWVGSGTGPVQARMLGVNGIGIDVDPIACLIAKVSLTPYSLDELDDISAIVDRKLELIEAELSSGEISPGSWLAGSEFLSAAFKELCRKTAPLTFGSSQFSGRC